MHPVLFEVFGRQVASYGTFMVLGAAAAWLLVRALGGKADDNVWMSFLICVCGGITGAFLFRPVTRIPELFIHWESFRGVSVGVMMGYLFGELVFYGGLIGGVTALFVFCGRFGIPVWPLADLFAPAVALAHAFGRVGCFLGGCCYGVEVHAGHPLAVRFPAATAGGAPVGVPLLAVQLVEAACLLLICAALVAVYYVMYKRLDNTRTGGYKTRPYIPSGTVICLYGILYGVLRFVLEFYRGDLIRGVYGPLSTSQYVSIIIICASVAVLIRRYRKNRRNVTNLSHNEAKNRGFSLTFAFPIYKMYFVPM